MGVDGWEIANMQRATPCDTPIQKKISMGSRWSHMGNWYGIRVPICQPYGAIHLNGPNWYTPLVLRQMGMQRTIRAAIRYDPPPTWYRRSILQPYRSIRWA